jgi:hypothetical protein
MSGNRPSGTPSVPRRAWVALGVSGLVAFGLMELWGHNPWVRFGAGMLPVTVVVVANWLWRR